MKKVFKHIFLILIPLLGIVFVLFSFYFDRGLFEALTTSTKELYKNYTRVGFLWAVIVFCFVELLLNIFDAISDFVRYLRSRSAKSSS